jgi:secreted trypsin-like serine protease
VIHQLPNPLFRLDEFSYDQMVLKLAHAAMDRATNTTLLPTVKIHLEENFPVMEYDSNSTTATMEISVIGFGQTQTFQEIWDNPPVMTTNFTLPPPITTTLQLTTVDYIPSQDCQALFAQDNVDYATLITDDMMCAWRNGTGQCHGDSGGPYLLLSTTPDDEDVQIGIISFGVGCAHPKLPAVGSRTSATQWIRHATCVYSQYPPEYFDCERYLGSDQPSMSPSSPTISPQPTVQQVMLTLTLRFDMFPEETGWELWDDSETILYDSRPAGTYNASHLDMVVQ